MLKLKNKDKLTGILHNDGIYVTFRTRAHYFIKFGGFGISADILQELRNNGCKRIRLIYTRQDGTQEVYETYPEKLFELGELWKNDINDYQRILRLENWNMDKSHQKKGIYLKEQQKVLI